MTGVNCLYPGCDEPAVADCDCCPDHPYFCEEHGVPSRDRETEYGPVAYPSQCWRCGGYDG
jgi:hypothetical protein